MSNATLDRLLGVLIGVVVVTGGLTIRAGTPDLGWVYTLHALAAGVLAGAAALKLRRSVPRAVAARRVRRLAVAAFVTLVVAAGLAGGYAWVVLGGVPSLAGFTVMTLHAWAGLAIVPIIALHLLPRRWTILRPGPRAVEAAAGRVSRRSVLAAAGLGGVALLATSSADILDRAGRERRRFTGSRPLERATIPPATTFIADSNPGLAPEAWRLRVGGRVARAAQLSIQDLEALGLIDTKATLDCTSGWTVETTWRGVPLMAVVEGFGLDPSASTIVVRSETGWSSALPIDEARGCLLAIGVAGVALPSANGAPCRLVVPTRRGLDWVKWVTDIEVL